MKKIWQLLKSFLKDDFKFAYYLTIAAFLGVLITLNYIYEIEAVIDTYYGQPIRIFYYFILYGVAYGGACGITFYFNRMPRGKNLIAFVLISFFGILVLSNRSGFPHALYVMKLFDVDNNYYTWLHEVCYNWMSMFMVFVPLIVFSYLVFSNKKERLGLNAVHLDLRPYLWLLLIVFPLVVIASFETGFKNYYPLVERYLPFRPSEPLWIFSIIYELSYASDFINVELLFRGFFVIGISQLIGKDAVIPMAVMYCSLHFGKPLGEEISSIFGGYILGVIAFYTRNIWGGIMVHIGLAWMMEAVAYTQKAI